MDDAFSALRGRGDRKIRGDRPHIRHRLRTIIVHQKKRRRFLLRKLKAKRVTPKAAGAAYSPKGRWFRSNHADMTQAYPPGWFTARVTSLRTRWTELNRTQASVRSPSDRSSQRAGC